MKTEPLRWLSAAGWQVIHSAFTDRNPVNLVVTFASPERVVANTASGISEPLPVRALHRRDKCAESGLLQLPVNNRKLMLISIYER